MRAATSKQVNIDAGETVIVKGESSHEDVPGLVPVSTHSGGYDDSDDDESRTNSLRDVAKDVDTNKRDQTVSQDMRKESKMEKKVSWGDMNLRMFGIIPGDHPDCLLGTPLTLEWDSFNELGCSIEEYEDERLYVPRRHDESLRISWLDRKRLLNRAGFTNAELGEAESESSRVRIQRQKTLQNLKLDKVQSFPQKVARKLSKAFSFPRPSALKTKY